MLVLHGLDDLWYCRILKWPSTELNQGTTWSKHSMCRASYNDLLRNLLLGRLLMWRCCVGRWWSWSAVLDEIGLFLQKRIILVNRRQADLLSLSGINHVDDIHVHAKQYVLLKSSNDILILCINALIDGDLYRLQIKEKALCVLIRECLLLFCNLLVVWYHMFGRYATVYYGCQSGNGASNSRLFGSNQT